MTTRIAMLVLLAGPFSFAPFVLSQDAQGLADVDVSATGEPIAYPRFSWDSVPVCIHFGKTKDVMTDDEVEFVARSADLVCLEKGHGRGRFAPPPSRSDP